MLSEPNNEAETYRAGAAHFARSPGPCSRRARSTFRFDVTCLPWLQESHCKCLCYNPTQETGLFQRLRWRPDRAEHIGQHGLSPEDVEEAVFADSERRMFRGPRSDRDHSRYVYYVYGRTLAGRNLLVVLLDIGRGEALPVTARDMTRREQQRYRER